ncbi:MAG: DUF2255 family protein [Chloroflexota bacterium]|nr:DUF2255 family protein [Chloroflexota bacterium]
MKRTTHLDRPAGGRAAPRRPLDGRLIQRIARRKAVELEIPNGRGGSQRWPVWVVRVGSSVYVRARRGTRREWYQWLIRRRTATLRVGDLTLQARAHHVGDTTVIEAVSEAYARNYSDDASVGRMFLPLARSSTLELRISPGGSAATA